MLRIFVRYIPDNTSFQEPQVAQVLLLLCKLKHPIMLLQTAGNHNCLSSQYCTKCINWKPIRKAISISTFQSHKVFDKKWTWGPLYNLTNFGSWCSNIQLLYTQLKWPQTVSILSLGTQVPVTETTSFKNIVSKHPT